MGNCGNCKHWGGQFRPDGIGQCANIHCPDSRGTERFTASHSCIYCEDKYGGSSSTSSTSSPSSYSGSYGSSSSTGSSSSYSWLDRCNLPMSWICIVLFIVARISLFMAGGTLALSIVSTIVSIVAFFVLIFSTGCGWSIFCYIVSFILWALAVSSCEILHIVALSMLFSFISLIM